MPPTTSTLPSAPLRALTAVALFALAPAWSQSVPSWAAPSGAEPDRATAMASPPDPGGPPGTPGTPTQSVPLDGGLGLLALAGGAYAARRLRQR